MAPTEVVERGNPWNAPKHAHVVAERSCQAIYYGSFMISLLQEVTLGNQPMKRKVDEIKNFAPDGVIDAIERG